MRFNNWKYKWLIIMNNDDLVNSYKIEKFNIEQDINKEKDNLLKYQLRKDVLSVCFAGMEENQIREYLESRKQIDNNIRKLLNISE